MFASRGEDCIFFETVKGLRHFPHMVLQCVPLPRETGDMAPIYFKVTPDYEFDKMVCKIVSFHHRLTGLEVLVVLVCVVCLCRHMRDAGQVHKPSE